jgi:hypothetical protein
MSLRTGIKPARRERDMAARLGPEIYQVGAENLSYFHAMSKKVKNHSHVRRTDRRGCGQDLMLDIPHVSMRSMRSMRGGLNYRSQGPSLKVHHGQCPTSGGHFHARI